MLSSEILPKDTLFEAASAYAKKQLKTIKMLRLSLFIMSLNERFNFSYTRFSLLPVFYDPSELIQL